jgi:membrane protein YdbS with pleckstrin-like domain
MTQAHEEEQRPPRNQLDPRVVNWWRARLAAILGVVVVALVAYALIPGLLAFGGPWLLVPAAVVAALAAPLLVVLPRRWYLLHRWEVTDVAVHVRVGLLWQEWRVAPLSRVQSVNTVQGPLQKYFDLATVTVSTASVKGDLKIAGLAAGPAAELARQLTETTLTAVGDPM